MGLLDLFGWGDDGDWREPDADDFRLFGDIRVQEPINDPQPLGPLDQDGR
jgi:hypothetical protein